MVRLSYFTTNPHLSRTTVEWRRGTRGSAILRVPVVVLRHRPVLSPAQRVRKVCTKTTCIAGGSLPPTKTTSGRFLCGSTRLPPKTTMTLLTFTSVSIRGAEIRRSWRQSWVPISATIHNLHCRKGTVGAIRDRPQRYLPWILGDMVVLAGENIGRRIDRCADISGSLNTYSLSGN